MDSRLLEDLAMSNSGTRNLDMDSQEPILEKVLSSGNADVSRRHLVEELRDALEHGQQLDRELERVRETLESQSVDLVRMQEALTVLEGRTMRHESGQEKVRTSQHDVVVLAERMEQESSLRRDLNASVQQVINRERDQRDTMQHRLEELRSQVEQIQGNLASDRGLRQTDSDRLRRDHEDQAMNARVTELERGVADTKEIMRSGYEDRARFDSAVPGLLSGAQEFDERARASQAELRRLEDRVSQLESDRDRESELFDLVEQQRAGRIRTEERITALASSLEDICRDVAGASEERDVLRQQVIAYVDKLQGVADELQDQRAAMVEHFRRWTESTVDLGQRQVEEIERADRVARELLVRLTERSDEVAQEQPL